MNFNPPVVSMRPAVVPVLERRQMSTLFTVTDQDDDSQVLLYQFRDNGIGAGRLMIGNEVVPANTWREIPASQLNIATYQGAPEFAKETLSVRVYDGTFWSNVATGTITSGNVSPQVEGRDGRVPANTLKPISSHINYFDGDGDRAIHYLIVDRDNSPTGGRFSLRGEELPQARWFKVEAGDLQNLMYRGAEAGGVEERIGVMAWDGHSFSDMASFSMATTSQPAITPQAASVVSGYSRPFTDFVDVQDPDGDEILTLNVVDYRINADGGYWEYQGNRMPSAEFFTIPFANRDELFYVGGSTAPQAENVGVQAFDGFEFSPVSNFEIKTIVPPMISGTDTDVQRGHYLNMATGGSSPASGTIPDGIPILDFQGSDGDEISQFLFVDRYTNNNGGHFVFKGDRLPSGRWFRIDADELDQLEYRGGVFGPQSEPVSAMAFSNGVWSEQTTFEMGTLRNAHAPEVNLFEVNARLGVVMSLEGMFTWSDGDGDLLEFVRVYDTGSSPESGYFSINGVRQQAQTWINIPFDEISTVKYHLPTVANSEKIRMFASDGRAASTAETATINAIEAPVINAVDNDVSLDTIERLPVSSLIEQLDNGPSFRQYQLYDENTFFRSARLELDGNDLQQGVMHTLTAAEFDRVVFKGAETDFGRQFDPMLIRADNGVTGWSEWERVNVNTDPVGNRSLTSGTQWFDFSGSGKTEITYMFTDGNGSNTEGPEHDPVPEYYICIPATDPDDECNVANESIPLNQPQRETIREVLGYFETVADIRFREVPFSANADDAVLTFGASDLPDGVAAWAYLPSGPTFTGLASKPGDVWFDTDSFNPNTNFETGLGSAFRFTAYHEIGHAIGFKHPFTNPDPLSVFLDFDYNTVMSYTHDNVHNPFPAPYPEQPSSAMIYDVVEAQRLYGVNEEFNNNNNHYGNFFSGSYPYFVDNDEQHQTTLYDSGGIDTYNFTNHIADEVIDLREGTWSSVNGVPQTLRTAYLTVIENARGGFGNDNIRGNEISNLLFGNDGDDVLRGGGDNDIVRGGRGGDTYIWSLGDGRDNYREEGNGIEGEIDFVEFYDPSGAIDSLEDDFTFRRFGETLRIDLTLNQGEGQGTVQLVDFGQAGTEVEIMRIHGLLGEKIGNDIDLKSIYNTASAAPQRYFVTNNEGENGGFIAMPVT